jgi:sucrose-6-phosphate hydrolase SacC (GH32 family)
LLHWEEKDCALYPDELGTMFSGCGIVDKNNVTGLKENDNDVVLLYYTAAGGNSLLSEGKKFTQCLAFSTDGGVTFKKYDNNPIVSHIEAENRDPKVIYSEELQEYVMTLFLNENRYAILTSKDLLKWKTIQELALEGDAECPDFYPLPLNGDKNNIKWVLSGASDRYLVGEINNNAFHPIQPAKRLHYGRNSYASQTFSDIDEKDGRRIRIAWNTMEVPDTYFNDSMCFPTEMSLKSINGEPNLCTWPIDEIKKLYENTVTYENKEISGNSSFMAKLDGKALDMELDFITDDKSEFSINLFGMEITCKVSENLLQMCNHTMPLCRYNGKIKLRLLVDTLGAELFTDEGEAHMCIGFLCDYNLNNLTINPQNGNIKLLKCNISTLKSIWKEKI